MGRPEEADKPAPRRARTFVDFERWAWNDSISALGIEAGMLLAAVAILAMRLRFVVVVGSCCLSGCG